MISTDNLSVYSFVYIIVLDVMLWSHLFSEYWRHEFE